MVDIQPHTDCSALQEIQKQIASRLDRIEQKLDQGKDTHSFFSIALHAYRQHHSDIATIPQKLLALFSSDLDLKFPHRKLLEHLLQHYDFETAAFQELSYSKLAAAARVGKQAAREHLSLLQEKGYVERRDDGYRIWFRINQDLINAPIGGAQP